MDRITIVDYCSFRNCFNSNQKFYLEKKYYKGVLSICKKHLKHLKKNSDLLIVKEVNIEKIHRHNYRESFKRHICMAGEAAWKLGLGEEEVIEKIRLILREKVIEEIIK